MKLSTALEIIKRNHFYDLVNRFFNENNFANFYTNFLKREVSGKVRRELYAFYHLR